MRLIRDLASLVLSGRELGLLESVFYLREYYGFKKPSWEDAAPMEGALKDLVEGPDALSAGRALDLGCGTGRNTLYLAEHGWSVAGLDLFEKALRVADEGARSAGVSERTTFIQGAATRLIDLVDGKFDLALDVFGPASDLGPEGLARYAAALRHVMPPGGTLLIFTFVGQELLDVLESAGFEHMTSPDRWRHVAGAWHRLTAVPRTPKK